MMRGAMSTKKACLGKNETELGAFGGADCARKEAGKHALIP